MRKSLSDILSSNGDGDHLKKAWAETEAAGEFTPLPPGEYIAMAIKGELDNSLVKKTPGYKLIFEIIEGEHVKRKIFHDIWLTQNSLPWAKRDLSKVGINTLEQLEEALPLGIVCKIKLSLRKGDDGTEHNRVVSFEFLRLQAPVIDPFAPQDGDDVKGGNDVPF